jgi:hypothetical protein
MKKIKWLWRCARYDESESLFWHFSEIVSRENRSWQDSHFPWHGLFLGSQTQTNGVRFFMSDIKRSWARIWVRTIAILNCHNARDRLPWRSDGCKLFGRAIVFLTILRVPMIQMAKFWCITERFTWSYPIRSSSMSDQLSSRNNPAFWFS